MYEQLQSIYRTHSSEVDSLVFAPPVVHVYNPLDYAWETYGRYLEGFVSGPSGRTLLLGMNPGPWGMAQTGVPFGEVSVVRDWLRLSGAVKQPRKTHPARPILGFDCRRSEVSGRRLWGLFRDYFSCAQAFQQEFLVLNYCPLIFLEEGGRNRTPDRLPRNEREALFHACNRCLVRVLDLLRPAKAFGVGRFATERLEELQRTEGLNFSVENVPHPSPANPQANRDWAASVAPILGLEKRTP